MYLNHYNFEREPFQVTPDPSFLYLSPGHKEALAAIIYAVEKKKGFVLILGAVGVGKTTVLRAYLEKAEKENLKTIYIFNPSVSYNSVLKVILNGLGHNPVSNNTSEMTLQLYNALINEYKQNITVILIIDEAQNMPIDTLENLRMLSNLETTREKLIQIVFSAQPEFENTLNSEELIQLKQRIAVKVVIPPLSDVEGILYIRHRLKKAARKEISVFSNTALKKLIKAAKGVPRVINILCDNSLITAFGYGRKKVDIAIVREIISDFNSPKKSLFGKITLSISFLWILIGFLIGVIAITTMGHNQLETNNNMIKSNHTVKTEKKGINGNSVNRDSLFREKMVTRGDTLAKLVYDVYGHVNTELINVVKRANPHIIDENLIIEGRRILFPIANERREMQKNPPPLVPPRSFR